MTLALITIAILSIALTYAVFQLQRQISHTINVVGVYDFKVYENPECTIELTAYNWNTVNKGATYYKPIWVKNTGDTAILINWNTTEANPHNGVELRMERNTGDWVAWTYNTEKINVNPTNAIVARIVLVVASDATTGATSFTQNFGGWDS